MRKLVLATFIALLAALPAIGSALAAPRGLFGTYLQPMREDGAHIAMDGTVTPNGGGYDANGCKPVTNNDPKTNSAARSCLPAAGSIVQLADGRILYWNALEGTEQLKYTAVAQGGSATINDQSRLLSIKPGGKVEWKLPSPLDGGSKNARRGKEDLPLGPLSAEHHDYNDAGLFCSDQVQLADGRILDTGGTGYYSEPSIPGTGLGVIELEGQRVTRIFDPTKDAWMQASPMNHGRWYPALVTLADNRVFVASGVTKLIKPVYPSHPQDSGTNVVQSETYDVVANKWTDNGPRGEHDLPLFPRLHLLPNGKVYFDAAGQAFNPFGQSTGELGWNEAAVYDPATKTWTSLGMPGSGLYGGFRGSTFSAVLPLRPASNGSYPSASFLTAGGVLFPSPGSYFPVTDSRINTVTISGASESLSTITTGPLAKARWYSAGVPLPDGTVYAVNGADLDEVSTPGFESPIRAAELFTPTLGANGKYTGGSWRPAGTVARPRTYHNTAMLLPDGRVMIAGHAPIPTGYGNVMDVPGVPGVREGSNNHHDASFQIYEPPYWGKARPSIAGVDRAVTRGKVLRIKTRDAQTIAQVVLMRNTAQTHLVDGDARTVSVPIVARNKGSVDVLLPASGAVLPSGPYLLFINQNKGNVHDDAPGHVVPSKGAQVMVVG
jgi:hypothetical protein